MRRMRQLQRMKADGSGRRSAQRAGLAAIVTLVTLALAPAALATPAPFASDFGFEPAGLAGLPAVLTMDLEDGFARVGEAGAFPDLDVEVIGSRSLCILALGDNVCQADTSGITDAYSVIMSIQVVSASEDFDGPFTLFLSSLLNQDYLPSEVAVELDPTVPAGLDTSALSGFLFDGSFDPFVHVIDESFAPGVIYDCVGWTVQVGDTISFRYEVSVDPDGRAAPALGANAIPRFVPEPGTAILLGLGLAGLAVGRGGRGTVRA